ncbi:MAG: hypothetical protein MUQ27_06345, partial [Acidimicrobiia bacterium]|nr:hypothetical protein [Acidimicrobiia bacterium]
AGGGGGEDGTVVDGTVTVGWSGALVVVVGAAVVGLLDPSMYVGGADWVGSGVCCPARSGAIVVGGSMAVGVSVT